MRTGLRDEAAGPGSLFRLASVLTVVLLLPACAADESSSTFDESSVRLTKGEPDGLGQRLVRVFFVQPDRDDEALYVEAQGCVKNRPSEYGIKCYGYRSQADLDADAPDIHGNVQKTCFRVFYERVPAGTFLGNLTPAPLESRNCPSEAASSAANAETSLEPRVDSATGILVPVLATEVAEEGEVRSGSLKVSYSWPTTVSTPDILAFYNKHMPPTGDFGAYKACGDYPNDAWALNRSWSKPNGETLVVEVLFDPPRVWVIKNTGDLPC